MMPPLEFWVRLPFACLVTVGIWTLFQPGMLLSPIADALHKKVPTWVAKPLYDCVICFASLYGTAIWFLTGGDLVYWAPFCLALCGLNKLVAHNLLK
jgi:hypothetical protein